MKGGYFMNGFMKFLLSLFAVFTAVVGALVLFDKLSNKNRLKGDYLECDCDEPEEM